MNNLKILNLNCQKACQPGFKDFLRDAILGGAYDFFLLQEATDEVLGCIPAGSSYKFVRRFDEATGRNNDLCILYQKEFNLIGTGFVSFAAMRKDPVLERKHPCFGVLWADIEMEGKIWRCADIHLHSGLDQRVRIAELRIAKDALLADAPEAIVLAGDFNAGFPGEAAQMARVLAPEFAWTTRDLPPTLDSRYSENVPHLPNRIAALLACFGLGVSLRADHVFVGKEIGARSGISVRVLPDKVSDHSPVEISITPNS